MAVLHFYKGFGLEAEAEHLAYARKLADLCRKHGIRVGVYGTVVRDLPAGKA